jgi:DNA-nicking Smr family endonuclease
MGGKRRRDEDDAAALAEAMEGVVPIDGRRRVRPASRAPHRAVLDEAAQVRAHLQDLVDGSVPFDIADTDEYIEGAVQGLDRRIVVRLRRGEYSVQDHVDLHGLNRDEARAKVGTFIKSAHDRGLRCVLVIHGRGLRSKDKVPVLKERLKAWLTRGSIGTKVLAFTSAQRYDGATGAVYVLLRK